MDEARRERREKRAQAIAEARAREAERERLAKQKEESTRKKARKTKRKLIYFVIIGIFVLIVGLSMLNIVSLYHERAQLEKQQALLTETRDKLKHELENVNNPDYIEQQARTLLRLVKPGEVLYILPDGSDTESDEDGENQQDGGEKSGE